MSSVQRHACTPPPLTRSLRHLRHPRARLRHRLRRRKRKRPELPLQPGLLRNRDGRVPRHDGSRHHGLPAQLCTHPRNRTHQHRCRAAHQSRPWPPRCSHRQPARGIPLTATRRALRPHRQRPDNPLRRRRQERSLRQIAGEFGAGSGGEGSSRRATCAAEWVPRCVCEDFGD